jgi:thiamine monophosphate synthase
MVTNIAPKSGVVISASIAPRQAPKYGLGGVHIPNHRLKNYRKSAPCPKLLTASAHNLRELLRAKKAGITNILFSPIFASDSKSANKRRIGPIRLAKLARDFPEMNFIALGGIDRKALPRLKGTNIKAVAGVSFS